MGAFAVVERFDEVEEGALSGLLIGAGLAIDLKFLRFCGEGL